MVDRPLGAGAVARWNAPASRSTARYLARLSGEFAAQMEALEKEIHELAGQPFTIGSPQQLGDILFEKMGHKGGKKGKSGQYSTDVTVLEDLAGQGVEIARKVLDWRQLAKLKSTYTDSLQEQINPKTGRVHTSYSLVGAQTGRLSSTDPNLQNIPIRTEMGRQIRDAFVAEPGNVILSADYSQIELRLAAHFADVAPLRDAFEKGEDIHARTAQEMFGEVNRDTRGRAKTINFSILYGISRWGLAKRLESTPDEAQALIDAYFKRFPGYLQLYSGNVGDGAEVRPFHDFVRPQDMVPADQICQPGRAARKRARRDQCADPGDKRGYHQARHGPYGAGFGGSGATACENAVAGP